ncbi:alpha-tubulin N-acetyltransferase-like [Cimex lectularius]|uniref:Alpha-tubulin N-acetyltransferase n=1 Tax=Cimex lectularius TaxID=79782 RepID=A0A8I6RVS7_CIMLE|nr:alpha-tubulin N-acetyltransferase-like [Cimex lectularius]
MNFDIGINSFFRREITKIDNTLLPEGFNGDRRSVKACMQVVHDILNVMGAASAKAQGVGNPMTSAEKLRNSDHIIYLLVDRDGNKSNGSVIGMLKMGWKRLYMFDEHEQRNEAMALCVLDFYIHESKHRMGYGKKLFDYMLQEEGVEPEKLAFDCPSENFLRFLQKHYNLTHDIYQSNNFVVFSGFFNNSSQDKENRLKNAKNAHHCGISSPKLSPCSTENKLTFSGRHTAFKRVTTMGEIVQPSHLM